MSLSVVIPAYNEEKYLPKLLESLERANRQLQTQRPGYPVEVIVVDNCSTDRTVDVAMKYQATVVGEKKRNIAAVRNRGVAVSNGKFLILIDADYRVENNFLIDILDEFDEHLGVVALGVQVRVEPNEIDSVRRFLANSSLSVIRLWKHMSFGVFAFRRDYFERIGGFDEGVFGIEDLDIHERMNRDFRSYPRQYLILNNVLVYTSARGFYRSGMASTYVRMIFFPKARRRQDQCSYWYQESVLPVFVSGSRQSSWKSVWDMILQLPSMLSISSCLARRLTKGFTKWIDPFLFEYVADSQIRQELHVHLLPFTVKVAFFIQSYAKMIGVKIDDDVCLQVGAFTRLYDDWVDDTTDSISLERIGCLFSGVPFFPATNMEVLMIALYKALEASLPIYYYSTCHQSLYDLHQLQIKSLAQHGNGLTNQDLLWLTLAKGAKAQLVFCGVARPQIASEEQALIEE